MTRGGGLVTLADGSGGKATRRLVEGLFVKELSNPLLDELGDAAVADGLAFTTDSFVVKPLFFPGGDIGELAVNGTVNDLAVAGAEPLLAQRWLRDRGGLSAGRSPPHRTLDVARGRRGGRRSRRRRHQGG